MYTRRHRQRQARHSRKAMRRTQRKSRRAQRKRGGGLMQMVKDAAVPFGLFAAKHVLTKGKVGKRSRGRKSRSTRSRK